MRILLTIILFLFISCESSRDEVKKSFNSDNPYYSELNNLIKDTQSIEFKLNRNIILRSSSNRQRNSFVETIFEIKKLLLLLSERPNDNNALIRLFNMKSDLEYMPMQARDVEFLDQYINNLNQILVKLLNYQQKNIADLNWEVWQENFNAGFALFTTFASNDVWQIGNRNRQGYVSARTRRDESWLITPKINLKNITNPAFSLNYVVNIKQNESMLIDSKLINKNCIKIMVSNNYEFGEPSLATWKEIDFEDVILQSDFNSTNSSKVSLKDYTNEIVSLAFVLDISQVDIGGHGLLWQINNFKLYGAKDNSIDNETPLIIERLDPTTYTYQYDFKDGFDNFTELKSGENPAEYKMTNRNGKDYLEINSFQTKSSGINILVSPVITLSEMNYYFRFEQAIKFYSPAAQAKKLINVFIGADNTDLNIIEWEEIALTKVPSGNDWAPVLSEWVKLPYKNQNIRIAFKYESGTEPLEYPNWNLFKFDIKEEEIE